MEQQSRQKTSCSGQHTRRTGVLQKLPGPQTKSCRTQTAHRVQTLAGICLEKIWHETGSRRPAAQQATDSMRALCQSLVKASNNSIQLHKKISGGVSFEGMLRLIISIYTETTDLRPFHSVCLLSHPLQLLPDQTSSCRTFSIALIGKNIAINMQTAKKMSLELYINVT